MKTIHAGDRMGGVLFDVQKERERQEQLKADGTFKYSLADIADEMNECAALAVLAEEFGEAAKEVSDIRDLKWKSLPEDISDNDARILLESRREKVRVLRGKLRTEIVQLAACCVAWAEQLDERENREQIRTAREFDDEVMGTQQLQQTIIRQARAAGVLANPADAASVAKCVCPQPVYVGTFGVCYNCKRRVA